jgi:hypothetical protein
MPLTAANISTLLNMLTALAQRQQMLLQLAGHFQSGSLWRSPDGELAVAITDDQRNEIVEFATAYLNESEILIAAARSMLAKSQ